jgi:hypothetical protein
MSTDTRPKSNRYRYGYKFLPVDMNTGYEFLLAVSLLTGG